jgi:hypothetical protein
MERQLSADGRDTLFLDKPHASLVLAARVSFDPKQEVWAAKSNVSNHIAVFKTEMWP